MAGLPEGYSSKQFEDGQFEVSFDNNTLKISHKATDEGSKVERMQATIQQVNESIANIKTSGNINKSDLNKLRTFTSAAQTAFKEDTSISGDLQTIMGKVDSLGIPKAESTETSPPPRLRRQIGQAKVPGPTSLPVEEIPGPPPLKRQTGEQEKGKKPKDG